MRPTVKKVDIDKLVIPEGRSFLQGYNYKDEVHLIWKDGPARHHSQFRPSWYFFIRTIDASKHKPLLTRLRREGYIQKFDRWFRNHEYIRVFCQNKGLYGSDIAAGVVDGKTVVLSALEEAGIPTFEADLTPLQRVMIDKDVKIGTTYRIGYLDIETKDVGPDGKRIPIETNYRGEAVGGTPILSFAMQYRDGRSFYFKAKSDKPVHEIELLQKLLETLRAIDIVATFNGKKFDIPFIRGRCDRYKMYFDWRRLIHVDICDRMRDIHKQNTAVSSFSLDFLCQHFLKIGKIEHPGMNIWDMFRHHPDLLRQYNLRDVELLWKLDEHEQVIKFMLYQSRLCGIFLSQFGPYNLIDGFIRRSGHLDGTPLPTAQHPEKIGKFRGAYVVPVKPGLYKSVKVFDFKGLYPSLIRTWNIGNDTLILGEPPDGVSVTKSVLTDLDGTPTYFSLALESSLAKAVAAFRTERDRCQGRMKEIVAEKGEDEGKKSEEWINLDIEQNAWKILANSSYGITAAGHREYNRYFSREVAESITMGGREVHHLTEEWFLANYLLSIVAGDTDSVFVPITDHDPKDLLEHFHRDLPGIMKTRYGCPRSFIQLEFDKAFKKILIFKMKNYAGILESGKFVAKGFGFVKRDTPGMSKRILKNLVEDLLRNERDAAYYQRWLKKLRQKILHAPIPTSAIEEYVVHKKLSKGVDGYKSEGIHVKIARDLRADGGDVSQGTVVRFVYVVPDGSRAGKDDALDPEIFKLSGRELDRKKYWNVYVLGKILPILQVVFPNEDWGQFDDTQMDKRKKLLALWKKRLHESAYFRQVIAEVRDCPWMVDVEKERFLSQLDPDEAILLGKKLHKKIMARVQKLGDGYDVAESCSVCGADSLHRGSGQTAKFDQVVTICTHCGHESKKQTRRDVC